MRINIKSFGDLFPEVLLESLVHFRQFLLHARVPMILNCVVSPPLQNFRDFCPLVAVVSVHQVQYPLFLLAPPDLLDLGIQVVVPPLPALLADSPRQMLRDQSPLLRPVLVHQVQHHLVFVFSPRSLDETRIQDLLPSVQTLHVSPPGQLLGDLLPVLASVLLHCVRQLLILFLSPVAFAVGSRSAHLAISAVSVPSFVILGIVVIV